jgi:NitT/TauT family transport system substrate-binding protein
MNRRLVASRTALILILLSASVISGCQPASANVTSGAPVSINVCYSALTATQVPVLYAYEKGLFAQHGLDISLTYIESGTTAATSMIAGEEDICQIAGSAVVNAAVAGEDLVIIAGLFNTYVYSVIVDPEIQTADDLRGKAVADSSLGSSSDAAMRLALQHFGLVPDKDVAVLALGSQTARVAGLESRDVVATVATIPESTRARQLGYRVLLNMATLNAPFQHTAIATSHAYVDAHRPQAVAFMEALIEGLAMMKQDKEGTMSVMAKYLQMDPVADRELLSAAYDDLIPPYLPDIPYPTLPGIQTLLDQLESENPAAANVSPEDVVDLSVLDQIEKAQ